MTIFALILCFNGTCNVRGNPYPTLTACLEFIHQIDPGAKPDKGRYWLGPEKTMYWQCASKHVDTWEPVR